MPKSLSILSFAVALGLGSASLAQDATPETTAEEPAAQEPAVDGAATADAPASEPAGEPAFSSGREVAPEEPAIYIEDQFGDWNLRCFRNPDGEDPCQLYQLLREADGNPIAEIAVFKLEGQPPYVAGATVVVPLMTLLPEELIVSIDGGPSKAYPYRVCTETGCIVQMALSQADVDGFKRGNKAMIGLVPAQAPDQRIKIPVSLTGFTAGYEAVGVFTQ
ncbi:invasion associated locus B family protein [Rhodobacteraceae bacterium KMM 6894]|nr:invasion associated locus B family protein [Rhodobacteraceae bacterium KMM 6894]